MRIAMVSEHASPLAELGGAEAGGQNLHVARLAAAVAALGHDVRVYTRRTSRDLPREVTAAPGVTVVHVPAGPAVPVARDHLLPYMRPFGRWLAGTWRHDGWLPDVVHAHYWMSGVAALVARASVSRPIVQTFHALGTVKRRHQRDQDTSPPNRIVLERAVGRHADLIIAQCADEVSELVGIGVPRRQIAVAPSGVDLDAFTPLGRRAARHAERPRILSVGRLVPRKGFTDLIEALPRVPGAELVIVGGPPRAQLDHDPVARQLREAAAATGVPDRVRLVGGFAQEDMPRWYRSAEVLACAPWYEPFGLTALEGMACGNPVVATAVGGLADSVVDGLTGDLVPARDPRALGDALRRLLASPSRRLAYGSAGVDRVRQCYTWPRTAEQVVAAYRAVSSQNPAVDDPAAAVAS